VRGEEGAVTVERTDRSEEKGIRKKKKLGKEIKVRKVYHVVFFLLGDSRAAELYMPTFRSSLSLPSSWVV